VLAAFTSIRVDKSDIAWTERNEESIFVLPKHRPGNVGREFKFCDSYNVVVDRYEILRGE
jgi:hypothetical protein